MEDLKREAFDIVIDGIVKSDPKKWELEFDDYVGRVRYETKIDGHKISIWRDIEDEAPEAVFANISKESTCFYLPSLGYPDKLSTYFNGTLRKYLAEKEERVQRDYQDYLKKEAEKREKWKMEEQSKIMEETKNLNDFIVKRKKK